MFAANPKDSFVLYALAKEYENSGDLNEALSFFENLRTKDPEYVGMYYHIGKLYLKLQREEEALSTFDKGITIAKSQGDQHALNELKGARLEIADEED